MAGSHVATANVLPGAAMGSAHATHVPPAISGEAPIFTDAGLVLCSELTRNYPFGQIARLLVFGLEFLHRLIRLHFTAHSPQLHLQVQLIGLQVRAWQLQLERRLVQSAQATEHAATDLAAHANTARGFSPAATNISARIPRTQAPKESENVSSPPSPSVATEGAAPETVRADGDVASAEAEGEALAEAKPAATARATESPNVPGSSPPTPSAALAESRTDEYPVLDNFTATREVCNPLKNAQALTHMHKRTGTHT